MVVFHSDFQKFRSLTSRVRDIDPHIFFLNKYMLLKAISPTLPAHSSPTPCFRIINGLSPCVIFVLLYNSLVEINSAPELGKTLKQTRGHAHIQTTNNIDSLHMPQLSLATADTSSSTRTLSTLRLSPLMYLRPGVCDVWRSRDIF